MKKLILLISIMWVGLANAQLDSIYSSRVSVSDCYDYDDYYLGEDRYKETYLNHSFSVYSQDSSWKVLGVRCDSLSRVPFASGEYRCVVQYPTDSLLSIFQANPDSLLLFDPYKEFIRDYSFPFSVGDSEEVILDLVFVRRYDYKPSDCYDCDYCIDSTRTAGGVFGYGYSNESAGEPVRWFSMYVAGAPMLLTKNYKWGIGGEFGGEWKYGYVRNQPAGYKYSTYTYLNFYEGFFMRYAMKQTGTFRWPYIDIGAKYHIPIAYRRTDRVSNKKLSTQYLHRWDDLRVYTRVGVDEFAVTAEYNPLERSQRGQHPLPKWSFGFVYTIGGHPGY